MNLLFSGRDFARGVMAFISKRPILLIPGATPGNTKQNWNTLRRVLVPGQSHIATYVTAPPDECDTAQASDSQALPRDTGSSTCTCGAATGLLFWPRGCNDEGYNIRTEATLREMDPKTLTSTDPLCQLKDALSF